MNCSDRSDTLILDTGKQVRLFGLQASKLPIGRPNFEAWPLSDEAATALRNLFLKNQNLAYLKIYKPKLK